MTLSKKQFQFIYQLHEGTHALEALEGEYNKGWMHWAADTGELQHIMVNHDARRQGIATALWNRAQRLAVERGITAPVHSALRTPEGDKWAKSLGEELPKRKTAHYDRGPKGNHGPFENFEFLDD